jgi:methylenetetrahydrofolate dehydrogenase (NADP+)/methenyltetrahydrofolate cyclohydrolase
VGISYEPQEMSLTLDPGLIIQSIRELSFDLGITGIMVQKPAKSVWTEVTRSDPAQFERWWAELTNAIDPAKDVDCLTESNLRRVYTNRRADQLDILLPATVRAVLSILSNAQDELHIPIEEWTTKKILVLGRSDIVGKPLTHMLRIQGHTVNNVGRKELPEVDAKEYDIIISAAGSPNVVTGDMVTEKAIVIDVGSPTNDVDRSTVERKAAFLTPVPGGVGPVTVISLMENIVSVGGR